MRKCPKCRRWTLDFDGYFSRFRCLNPACGWMPPSTAEREIRLLQSDKEPIRLDSVPIPELGLTLIPTYDLENDALSVDFGLAEPTFDLPDPDGRMTWRIARHSDMVAGFTIVGIREVGISDITIEFIVRRKGDIERRLRRFPGTLSAGRTTRDLVEQIVVTAASDERLSPSSGPEIESAWKEVVNRVQELTTT